MSLSTRHSVNLNVPRGRRLTLNGLRHRYHDPFQCRKFLHFIRRNVKIWSAEHGLYWRANAAGYTSDWDEAGTYRFEDAYTRTKHCGPEKRIEYILVGS